MGQNLIRSITNNYNKKHMKIKFTSGDNLPLKKVLEHRNSC